MVGRLDALCAYLAGLPAPGYGRADPLPGPVVEEGDGFTREATAGISAHTGVPADRRLGVGVSGARYR